MRNVMRKTLVTAGIAVALVVGPGIGMANAAPTQLPIPEVPIPAVPEVPVPALPVPALPELPVPALPALALPALPGLAV